MSSLESCCFGRLSIDRAHGLTAAALLFLQRVRGLKVAPQQRAYRTIWRLPAGAGRISAHVLASRALAQDKQRPHGGGPGGHDLGREQN